MTPVEFFRLTKTHTIVVLWRPWCPYCKRQRAYLQDLRTKLGLRQDEIVFVDADREPLIVILETPPPTAGRPPGAALTGAAAEAHGTRPGPGLIIARGLTRRFGTKTQGCLG